MKSTDTMAMPDWAQRGAHLNLLRQVGGVPDLLNSCLELDLNEMSGSPFRVPIACLASGLVLLALVLGLRLTDRAPKTLAILPLGKVDAGLITSVEARLESQLGLDATVLPAVALPAEAYTAPRNRYRADRLLPWLARQSRTDLVLGVTTRDISTSLDGKPDWGVFGLGQMPGRAAVVSTYRLGKRGGVDPAERLRRIAVHEVGHNLGLPHCPEDCIMADARGKLRSIDACPDFCRLCQGKIDRFLER